MATAAEFRRMALSLPGTTEVPHFHRAAFKLARIYATTDGISANLLLTRDEQEFKCLLAPDIFAPIPNKWGEKGWTLVTLAAASAEELQAVLHLAWANAGPKKKR